MKMNASAVFVLVGFVLLSTVSAQAEEEKNIVIQDGSKVSIEYTLKLEDGTTADTSEGREPLEFTQGSGQILPALEKELAGLKVNDTRKVSLTPEQGYGGEDPAAFQTVPLEVIPEGARSVGSQLVAEDGEGNRRLIRVHEIKESQVVLNLNHPLAGQTLHFDVKVVSIE